MDFKKITDKAKGALGDAKEKAGELAHKAGDALDEARDKAEDLAEKGIAKAEEKTGKHVPDAVKKAVDKIAEDSSSEEDAPEA